MVESLWDKMVERMFTTYELVISISLAHTPGMFSAGDNYGYPMVHPKTLVRLLGPLVQWIIFRHGFAMVNCPISTATDVPVVPP